MTNSPDPAVSIRHGFALTLETACNDSDGLQHMSRQKFAEAYRIPLPTLKNGEQGRRAPDAPAAAYLQAIARQSQVIRDALQHN